MNCHAWKPIKNGGVNLCTLLAGHQHNHLDTFHNVGWSPDHPDSRPPRGAGLPVTDLRRIAAR